MHYVCVCMMSQQFVRLAVHQVQTPNWRPFYIVGHELSAWHQTGCLVCVVDTIVNLTFIVTPTVPLSYQYGDYGSTAGDGTIPGLFFNESNMRASLFVAEPPLRQNE